MEKELSKIKPAQKYRLTIKWLIIIVTLFLVLYFGTLPVRGKLANRYVEAGDSLLIRSKYISADLDYQKALILKPKDDTAAERRNLAENASRNILTLERFYEENKTTDKLALFDRATTVPKNETEAVKLSKKLIEDGEYQLAIIPAATATEMDPTYRDAWLYLGIANLKTAELVEMKNEIRADYKSRAQEALNKAKDLDPTYQPTLDFIKEAQK